MDSSILTSIGLTADQAETYQFLLKSGALTPIQLMKLSGENRSNAYMSLAKLEDIGLAIRDEDAKKLTYIPVNPSNLEALIEERQQKLDQSRQKLDSALPDLLSTFYESTKKPGIRFYEGDDSLKRVYQDHLDTKEDVYFVRTPADEEFFGEELYQYMEKRAKEGITAYGLAPVTDDRLDYSKKHDKKLKREMTWCQPEQYTAPVEISIYGNKVAYISFGKEVVASIIESPQIADAMRQLFKMAQNGSTNGSTASISVGVKTAD